MNIISQNLERIYPADDKGWGATVISMREDLVGDVRPALLMMLGAVAFVLLIACANVANLIFGRAFARRKEIAIRSALGASRSSVVQLLLIESMIVAVAGGALGLFSAHYGIELLLKFFADKLPRMGEIGLSGPVLLFTLALSIVTGLLSGLAARAEHDQGRCERVAEAGPGAHGFGFGQRPHTVRACHSRGRAVAGASDGRGADGPQPLETPVRRSGIRRA